MQLFGVFAFNNKLYCLLKQTCEDFLRYNLWTSAEWIKVTNNDNKKTWRNAIKSTHSIFKDRRLSVAVSVADFYFVCYNVTRYWSNNQHATCTVSSFSWTTSPSIFLEISERHATDSAARTRISLLSRAVIFEGHVLRSRTVISHWLTKTHNKIHGLLLYGLCLLLQQLILPVFFILAPTRHHPS